MELQQQSLRVGNGAKLRSCNDGGLRLGYPESLFRWGLLDGGWRFVYRLGKSELWVIGIFVGHAFPEELFALAWNT